MLKTHILLCCLLLLCQVYARAQDKTIRITNPTDDITSVAKLIATQTGWHYSLNMQNSSLKKKIKLKPGNYTLSQVLKEVKIQAKLDHKIVGNHLIFVDYRVKENITTTSPPSHTNSIISASLKQVPTPVKTYTPHPIETIVSIKDTTRFNSSISPGICPGYTLLTSFNTITDSKPGILSAASKDSLYKVTAKAESKRNAHSSLHERKSTLFAKAGFAVDEIFYANAVLEGGFNFLYGIASYGTTFNAGGFRWGAGLSLPLNEYNRVHLTFTTGNMRKTYDFDTFPQLLTLKETLHRFGAAWSKQVNDKISVQLQVHYNLLLKDFTRNETTNKPNPLTGDFDKQYYIIKPPYTLSKSVGETSVTKSWIGIQCTFFYRL